MTPSAPNDARTSQVLDWLALAAFGVGLAGLAAGFVYGDRGPSSSALIAFAAVALAGAAGIAYGPVLVYEMIRTARRGRLYLLRWLYVIGLFLLLLWVVYVLDADYYRRHSTNDYKYLTRIAESYFYMFASTQFLVLATLTPAFVAGSIAEEKERKTLEFLLATDLSSREIVFGKLTARLGTLALFVIAGLPILSIMQFFGGIDFGILLTAFAATGIAVLSLAAVSLFNSVARRRARDAILLTYLAAIGYLAFTGLTAFLKFILGQYAWLQWGPLDLNVVFDAFHAGNPIFGLIEIVRTIDRNGPLADVLVDELRSFAAFHGLVVIFCVTWSVLRLRAIALAQAGGGERKKETASAGRRKPKRRPVGSMPMAWKEVWVEGTLRLNRFGRFFLALLVLGSFAPVVIIASVLGANGRVDDVYEFAAAVYAGVVHHFEQFGQGVNVWLRVMNTIVGTLMLLGVAARSAGTVGIERDRDTLTSLMTTPLSTQEILWGKWLGGMASVRAFLWWLVPLWAIGIAAGGVNPVAGVLMALAWLAPASFFAAWGLFCSVTAATTLRATTWAVLGALFFGGVHWVCCGMCFYAPIEFVTRGDDFVKFPVYLETAMSPPAVFAIVPFRELRQIDFGGDGLFGGFLVLGIALWTVGSGVVGALAHERFVGLTHRAPPARVPIPPLAEAKS